MDKKIKIRYNKFRNKKIKKLFKGRKIGVIISNL